MESNKKNSKISEEQKREMLDFMRKHPELMSGKFSKEFSFATSRTLWQTLETNLNSLSGAKKDWVKWRKTWHDMKSSTKAKCSSIKQYRAQTGGGPEAEVHFTSVEEEIISLVGPVATEGHPHVNESQAVFEMPNTPEESMNEVTTIEESENIREMQVCYSTQEQDNTEHNIPCSSGEVASSSKEKFPLNTNKNKSKRIHRLEHTIAATTKLAEQTQLKISIKEKYYQHKLRLYEKDIAVKQDIATALQVIAKSLEKTNEKWSY